MFIWCLFLPFHDLFALHCAYTHVDTYTHVDKHNRQQAEVFQLNAVALRKNIRLPSRQATLMVLPAHTKGLHLSQYIHGCHYIQRS